MTAADVKAQLGPAESDTGYVQFQYNPATIVISHTAPLPSSKQQLPAGTQTYNMEETAKALGTTSLALRSCIFDGKDTMKNCQHLLDWSHPKSSEKDENGFDPQYLRFVWGPMTTLVTLHQATITYNRFNRSGTAVRASVDLTLHKAPDPKTYTNPSSGGLPGRRVHLLTGAESLPELATRTYGGPGHWREIARANRIDDPLRVRPGTHVFLPSAQEGER